MGTVEDHLIAGISVDGGHDTALDGSVIVKSLSHGSKAVGGAGSCTDDGVVGSEGALVDAEDDGLEVIACGSRDNDLLSACIDVSLALSLGAVEAGALKNNINVKLAPGKILRVGHSIDGDLLAVNYDSAGNLDSLAVLFILSSLEVYGVKILAYSSAIAALSGIVLEKVCKHLGAGKIVDSNNLVALCAEHLTECKTTDTAKAVNSNFN